MQFTYGTGKTIRGLTAIEDFAISTVPRISSIGAQTGTTPTVKDVTYIGHNAAGTRTEYDVVVANPLGNQTVTFATATPGVCTVNAAGNVSVVGLGGVCEILATGRGGIRKVSGTIGDLGSAAVVYDSITGYVSGSLRKYLYDQQIAALVGITPGLAAQQSHDPGSNTYNTNNFMLRTGISGFTALPADALERVLHWGIFWITPHHYIQQAGHSSNETYGVNKYLGYNSSLQYSASPYAGTLCKVIADADWATKLPAITANLGLGGAVPVWARLTNTYQNNVYGSDGTDQYYVQPVNLTLHGYTPARPVPAGDLRLPYQRYLNQSGYQPMINGGDSGSPVFMGINGSLVTLAHVSSAGVMAWSDYTNFVTLLNAKMKTLAQEAGDVAYASYNATPVDLSGFTSF